MMEDEELLYKCNCKATDREEGEPGHSANWVASKRARLKIYEDRVECGDWTIPLSQVLEAKLYTARQFLLPVKVLHLVTAGGSYQFGYSGGKYPEVYLPFKVPKLSVRLKHSAFSLILRVFLYGYIVYWAWAKLSS